jgi:glutaminase
MQALLEEIADVARPFARQGRVADYIPALASVSPDKFGIAVSCVDGREFTVGQAHEQFSTQSISKVFALTLVFQAVGEKLWKRVGKEPSGNPFNSLVQLEYERGIPRNPFINAGALVVVDALMDLSDNAEEAVLSLARGVSRNASLMIDEPVASSEQHHGDRNAALAHFMKSFGNIRHAVDDVIASYFRQCAIAMSCIDLARAFLFLANRGVDPASGQRLLTVSQAKRLNALLLTCGLYDESGDFAFRVGMSGKSGVGGGIVAVIPGELSICVWSPPLNSYGNSVAGIQALEMFTTRLEKSIF